MNLKDNKLKKSDLTISILLIVGILAVLNFLSYQIFTHLDLTKNKIYSISKVSKDTVKGLDDVVNVKVYFSSDLPTQYIALRQDVTDILSEYQAFSKGNVNVEYIDPTKDDQTAQDLYAKGIPQLTFQAYEKDKAQVVNGYMGMTIAYGDKTETIPVIKQDTSGLEYQITTAIKKATSKKIATVAFLTSNGTADIQQQISSAYQAISELYTVDTVDLSKTKEIPSEVDTLIIVGPKDKFSDDQLKAINAFLVRGGKVLALVDGVMVEQGLTTKVNNTGIETLLAKYGVKINNNLVADVRNAMATFNQGYFSFSTNYPFWLKLDSTGFNKDNSAVSGLQNVVLQWASSLDTVVGKEKVVTPLAFTSNKAWQVKDKFDLAPNNALVKIGNEKFNVADLISGQLDNAYPEAGGSSTFNGRLIVVGDSDFANNNSSPENLTFFQDLVDSLSLDNDLISIRAKSMISQPIKDDLTDSEKVFIRYANIFGITIIVIAFGMIRYYLRRKNRFVDEL